MYFPKTMAQLNKVLKYILEFEPAVKQVEAVWDTVQVVTKSVNEFIDSVNARKFDEAQAILDAARDVQGSAKQRFDEAAKDQSSVNFQRFYKLAAENRSLQDQALTVGSDLIRFRGPQASARALSI